jgi:single-stranded-DNA-specific exonuclease
LASEALELLLCADEASAEQLAQKLEHYNEERQQIECEILAQAIAWLEANAGRHNDRVLVFAGEGWHEGVIGIIASRLVERYGKPCLMVTLNGEKAKGSGRSLPGFHLFDALHNSAHLMQKYGGHELAAGFSLPACEVDRLREEVNAYAASLGEMPFLTQQLDAKLNPARLTPELADELALLEPFGQGNPQPVFALQRMTLLAATLISENKHLRLTLEQNSARVTVMAFRTTKEEFDFAPGDLLDIAVTLEANEFRGQRDVTLILRNAKFSLLPNEAILQASRLIEAVQRHEACSAEICPAREDGALVYRILQKLKTPAPIERILLLAQAKEEDFARLWLAAQVLRELGIVGTDGAGRYSLAPPGEKIPWEQAELVNFLKGV